MRQVIIIFLMLCAVGIGAYDSSAIEINCGGYGASDSSGVGSWGGHTAAAPSYPFGVDGTLTEVKLRFRGGTDVPTSCILKILYGANPVYSQRGSDVSILTDAVAAYAGDGVRYTVEATGLSIPVQAGDFLAVYISGNLNMHEVDVTGDFYVYHDAGNVTTLSMASSTPSELIGSCTIETDEYIIYDGSTGWLGTNTIPLATPDTEPYYIVLENVQVPDTESMTIALDYTNTSTGENTTEELYTIDYSGGANDGYIYDTDDSTRWEPIKGQKGSGIDYYIYVNPTMGSQDLYYCNLTDGQGHYGDKDVKHLSLNDREVDTITAANKIRRITLTNAGGNAMVERVVVTRKPIVVLGDSFTSTYSDISDTPDRGPFTRLSNIGARMDDAGAWSQDRYVINGGISGTGYSYDSANLATRLLKRWNSLGSYVLAPDSKYYQAVGSHTSAGGASAAADFATDLAAGHWKETKKIVARHQVAENWAQGRHYIGYHEDNDLCAYRDVVYCIVNGGSVWDAVIGIGSAETDLECASRAWQLLAAVSEVAASTQDTWVRNDVMSQPDLIICEMIPRRFSDLDKQARVQYAQSILNEGLELLAYRLNVPFARLWDKPYTLSDNVHPDNPSDLDIMMPIIRDAYENNQVPRNPIGNGCPIPTEECVDPPYMDSNGDCKVDFIDFCEFASEWMTCGLENQSNCWE